MAFPFSFEKPPRFCNRGATPTGGKVADLKSYHTFYGTVEWLAGVVQDSKAKTCNEAVRARLVEGLQNSLSERSVTAPKKGQSPVVDILENSK